MSDKSLYSKDDSLDDPDYSDGDNTPEESESDGGSEANDAAEYSTRKTKRRRKASQYYIGAGVAADCLTLITRCSMISDLNYQKFLKEYVAMGFQYIFCGRKSKATTLELSEEIVSIAKSIFVKPDYDSYDDRRAAMYLLYSLVVSQPVESFAFVWVDSNAAFVLGQFEIEARKRNDREMLYCMGVLYARGLIHFTAADAEYGLSKPILHNRSEFLEKRKKAAVQKKSDFSRHDIESLQGISACMEAYDKCKKEAIDWSDPSDARSLNFISASDLDGLVSIMKRLQRGDYDEPAPSSLQNELHELQVNYGETIRQKKLSAMAAPVKQAQHHVTKLDKYSKITKKHSPVNIPNKKPNYRDKTLSSEGHCITETLTENYDGEGRKKDETTQQTHMEIESQEQNEVLIVIETMDEDDISGEASSTNEVPNSAGEPGKETSTKDENKTAKSSSSCKKQRSSKKKKR